MLLLGGFELYPRWVPLTVCFPVTGHHRGRWKDFTTLLKQ